MSVCVSVSERTSEFIVCFSFNTFGLLIDTNRNTKFYRKIISNHLLLRARWCYGCSSKILAGAKIRVTWKVCVPHRVYHVHAKQISNQNQNEPILKGTQCTSNVTSSAFHFKNLRNTFRRWCMWMINCFQKRCWHCTLEYTYLYIRSSFVVVFVSLLLLLSLTPHFRRLRRCRRRRRFLLLFM